jgi:hypothetical protein
MTAISPAINDPDATGEFEVVSNGSEPTSSRQRRLSAALDQLKKVRSDEFPLARILLILGGLCLPIGVVVILIGWYGSAHTLNPYEQNDYLISGGLLGLALVNIGGFLYFGYWMTRQLYVQKVALRQSQTNVTHLEDQLSRMASSIESLATVMRVHSTNGSAPAARLEEEAAVVPAEPLVATERGSLVHRISCSVVAGKTNLRTIDPLAEGFRPCQICSPFED